MTRIAMLALATFIAVPLAGQVPSDTGRLRDLIVTATRIPTSQVAVPAATTIIRGEDLRERGVHYVLDALRDVPGMAVVQTGSFGAVASVFLRGGESDDVKVLLDGVPLNLPGGGINFANLTTDDLDRIEIVRGPASVLYGADAMSGVVQLFTRRADPGTRAELAGSDGGFGTSDVSGHVNWLSGGWSVGATGARLGSNGTYGFNDGYRNGVGSLAIGFASPQALQAALTLRYGDAKANFPTDGSGNPVDHNQFTTEKSLAAGLMLSRPLGERVSLHLQGVASRLLQGYTNRSDSPADTVGFDFVDDRTGVTWRRGADARMDWDIASATLVSIGAGMEHETDDEHEVGVSNFGFGASHDTAAFAGERTTRDAYLQALASPVAALSFQLGARVDDNSAFGTFGTWRVGTSWRLSAAARLWASAGTAFKAPTFSQLFAATAFEVGNPDLAPERSRNAEIGADAEALQHRVRLSATIFWQQFRDLIQYVAAAPGEPTYVNLGGASSRGVEASVNVQATHRLTVNANWTWLHTEVTDTGVASSPTFQQGASLIRRPGQSGGVMLTYRFSGPVLVLDVRRTGARDDVDFSGVVASRVTLSGYTTADLSVDAPLRRASRRSPGIDLTLRGENLFNAAYQQAVGFPGRGRTLLVGGRLWL
ncbi:MAG: TonB-dependent receptor plug domain-containing protein [Gemmatimonadales bacterium]